MARSLNVVATTGREVSMSGDSAVTVTVSSTVATSIVMSPRLIRAPTVMTSPSRRRVWKPTELGGQDVRSDRKARKHEASVGVGQRGARQTGFTVPDGHRDTRQDRAGCVDDPAVHVAGTDDL